MPPDRRVPRLIRFPHSEGGVEQRESPRQAPPRRRVGQSGGFRHPVQPPICAPHRRFAAERPCLFYSRSHRVLQFPSALFKTDFTPAMDVANHIERSARSNQMTSGLYLSMQQSCARLPDFISLAKLPDVSAFIPLQLAPEDKLDLLRYLDEFHYWHSLDDERRCKRCSRVITGRRILVIELHGTRGKLRLQCPTVACTSTPSDWVYADPILAAKLRSDFRPAASQAGSNARAAERAYDDDADDVRRVKQPLNKSKSAAGVLKSKTNFVSFRAVAARSKLLRPIASGLHAIRPVA